MSAKLHILRDSNLRDIPATLREIADNIEQGRFGEAHSCVVVLDAFQYEVFYTGEGEAGPNAVLMMQVGIGKMCINILAEKGKNIDV
jgi:hypothetical protein